MGGLSVPQIIVNDEVIAIKPNSFSYTEGFGERTVRTKSAGGGNTTIVVTENAETQTSMVKFTILTEDTSIEKVRGWLALKDANRIQAGEGSFSRTFAQAVITNNPEAALGESGEIALEFTAQRAK